MGCTALCWLHCPNALGTAALRGARLNGQVMPRRGSAQNKGQCSHTSEYESTARPKVNSVNENEAHGRECLCAFSLLQGRNEK